MTAQQSPAPAEFSGSEADRIAERQVVRRATQLCRRAEPHTEAPPCPAHLSEASRQLLGLVD